MFRDGLTIWLSIIVEALPFLLIGVILSGILAIWVDERRLLKWLPKQLWLQSLLGGLFGFLFPVCECGNIVVARRLILKGIPPFVAIAFLLAAPVFNPVVIVATYVAFRDQPEIVIFRVFFSLGIAVLMGWIFSHSEDAHKTLLQPTLYQAYAASHMPQPTSLLDGGTFWAGEGQTRTAAATYTAAVLDAPTATDSRWQRLIDGSLKELRDLGSILVIGAAIAATLQTVLPRQWLVTFGQDPIASIVVMLILGLVVSICSTVDSFFALAFTATFTPGSLVAFLVFGPMVDLKNIGLMLSVFKPRTIALMSIAIAQLTFLAALLVNFYAN